MPYDIGKDKQQYLGSVRDFGHRRLAKQMVDAKRAAKAGPPMGDEAGGEMAPEGPGEDLGIGGAPDENAPPDVAAPEEMPEMAGEESAGLIPIEVSPEELEVIEQMRAQRG